MKLWRIRHRAVETQLQALHVDEAETAAAVAHSEDLQREAQNRWGSVDRVTAERRRHRVENHFGELIEQAMKGQ